MEVEEWVTLPGDATYWVDGSRIDDYWGGCAFLTEVESGSYIGRPYALGRIDDSMEAELRGIQVAMDHVVEGLKSVTFTSKSVSIWSDCMDSIQAWLEVSDADNLTERWSGVLSPGSVDALRNVLKNKATIEDHAGKVRVVWRKRHDGVEMQKSDELASSGSLFSRRFTRRIRFGEAVALSQLRYSSPESLR